MLILANAFRLGTAERGIISTAEAIALFDRIDADKSGTIDFYESRAASGDATGSVFWNPSQITALHSIGSESECS